MELFFSVGIISCEKYRFKCIIVFTSSPAVYGVNCKQHASIPFLHDRLNSRGGNHSVAREKERKKKYSCYRIK